MALITCPECGREISDKCAACPHCGYPLNESSETQQSNAVVNTDAETQVSFVDKAKDAVGRYIEQIRSSRKVQIITGCVAAGLVLAIVLPIALTANSRQYKKADTFFVNEQYEEAAAGFGKILEYRDSQDKYNISIFNQAKALYDSEKFDEAKALFSEIGNFNGASVMAEKCDYFQTIDGKFLLDFSRGLNARWKMSDTLVETDETPDSVFVDGRKKLINVERDAISKYQGMEFSDARLQEIYNEYTTALDDSENALGYFSTDIFEYSDRWDKALEKRTMLITELLTNYDIKVDKENELTKEQFLTNAGAYTEQNDLKDKLRSCLNNIHFEQIEDDYGWRTYEGYFTNETDYILEYVSIEVNLISKDGVVIESTYCNGANRLEPGQKARYEFMTDQKFDHIDMQISYEASKQ